MMTADLLKTVVATMACAVAGSAGTSPDSDSYRALSKPRWQPRPIAFPLVWTLLYADIAGSTASGLTSLQARGQSAERAGLWRSLLINLALNAGWPWLFFAAGRRRWAVVECALLTVSSADLVRRVRASDRRAGLALAPYPVWCAFATVLSADIDRRNPA